MKNRNLGLVLSYTNTFLSMVCGLFLSSFLLKTLGDSEYGVYQTIASFANYLVLLEFGAGTIMARNISACKSKDDFGINIEKNISTVWTITNILALLIASISIIFYFSIDVVYQNAMSTTEIDLSKRIFIFIVVFLLSSFYSQSLSGIALAFEDYTFSPKNNIFKLLSRIVLIIPLVLKFDSALMIVIVDCGISVIVSIYSYFYCIRRFKVKINFNNFDIGVLKTSLPLCLAIFLQGIINQANGNMGKFILGIKIGPEEVALYSVALYIYNIMSSLSTIPVSLFVPQITKNVSLGMNGMELTNTLIQPSRLIAIVSGSIVFGFISCGKPFISLIYGENYLSAWIIAIIIMLPMFIYSTSAISLNVLDAKNKRIGCSILLLFTTILNVVLTLILSDVIGIKGVAISTAISTIIGQVISLGVYYYKVANIHICYLLSKTYNGILIYQILGAIIGYLLSTNIHQKVLAFLISGFVYLLISLGGFVLLGTNENEKKYIKSMFRIIK